MSRFESKNNTRTIVQRTATIVLAAILLLSLCLFFVEKWEKSHREYSEAPKVLSDKLEYNGKTYELKDNIDTILILGLDKFKTEELSSFNNDKQADFLMLLVIDNSNKTYKTIQINRDTMTEMNVLGVAGDKIGTVVKQIALSHTYGNGKEISCRNVANAVSKLLDGVEVDHYISFTMDAVQIYNGLVDGVTVEVLDDFTKIDDTLVKGETVTLMGEQALIYVRARNGLEDATNRNRMNRQKQYLEALFDKSREKAKEDEEFISRAALKLTEYLVSDYSGNRLETLLEDLSEYSYEKTLTISGESVAGEEFMEFYPDETSKKEAVIDCFYKIVE